MGYLSLWPHLELWHCGHMTGNTPLRATRRRKHRVVLAVTPGDDAGDVFGPLDILRYASQFALEDQSSPTAGYAIDVVSTGGRKNVWNAPGVRLLIDRTYQDLRGPIDTLVALPIDEDMLLDGQPSFVAWLQRTAPRIDRVVGLCTGTFFLARAGLLTGRRVTTHWAFGDTLRQHFPDVHVETDPIYVRDGSVYTSAGALAGLDLMLALVEADLGREVARSVARFMVLYLKRPGGQAQFSVQLESQFAERSPLRDLQGWIHEHLSADLGLDTLAVRAAMSPRNFRRVFTREVGTSPGKYVEQARIEGAKRRLEDSDDSLEAVASQCGFSSLEHLRTTFVRHVGVNPSAYRRRFSTALRSHEDEAGMETLAR